MKPEYQTFIVKNQQFINDLNKCEIPVEAVQEKDYIIVNMKNVYYGSFHDLVRKGLINIYGVQHYVNYY
jgi:hypothetical protein